MTDANEMHDTIMLELNNAVLSDTDEAKEEQGSLPLRGEVDSDDIPPSLLSYLEISRSRAAACEKLIRGELEGEAGTDECTESEEHSAFDVRALAVSLNEQGRKKGREDEARRERRHCEETTEEEQKRQAERDFEKELKKIMETEKLRQKDLELMQKRAQEELEQELLLQQELISNLQRRVEEERRMMEEEQKRMKDEEAKRKREEELIKIEAERSKMEEETRRKNEEKRQIGNMKLKKEEERKKEEEEKKRMEREEKRKREEEGNMIDLEKKKKLEDEMGMMTEEEERKKKEEVQRIKKEAEVIMEEERKKMEEARKKIEKEKRNMEEEMSLKREEERKKREEENMRREEEGRITEERKKQVEMRKKKEEEADDRTMYEEMRKRDKRDHGNVDEEIKLEERKKKEENDRKKGEEEEEDARMREKERKKTEEKKEAKDVVRKKEGENRKMTEEVRPIKEDEMKEREDERKTREEEWRRRRRQKEEIRRQSDKEHYSKSEGYVRLKEDKEAYEGYDVDNRKMDHESKTKDEEKRKKEEERMNVEAEKEMDREEMKENKKEIIRSTEEEIRLDVKEESKPRMVQDREKEVSVVRANELQEKIKKREHHSTIDQKQKTNIDKTGNSLASQLEDSPTWNSSNPGSLRGESTIHPIPHQQDLDKNISQAATDKTVCLPEHTEQKRLSWMKDCIPWSKLSLRNTRKQRGSVQSRRRPRRAAEASSLPPLCPDSLLQAAGQKSLLEVTTVTLEDLPGCSLSTLAQCVQLRALTLRRCGLKSLEGLNQLPQLCYIDAQENDISFVDCENMANLRVLQLGHNKLTSIHGLAGAENLDVLDLSHNSITRIAGLESMRRLQRLSLHHNQLISTKGLRDVYTLLHLSCSHNHLASVEGLENNALLNTLDLRANSLTEPPGLNNQVLLRELHLDDNSISSLAALSACWLPLMRHLSVAQNRITQLPSMSDSVSLANLDLRFNCMSELRNVCESLEGCHFLREVHLTGNPLQQESGWRSTLQKAVPGLRAIDDQQTDSFLSPPAVQQVSLAAGSFLMFCQAQLQQTHDLQQQHSRELSHASSSLDAVKTSCRHFTEALQLANDQRFAHEYGDTTVADKHRAAGQKSPEETLDIDSTNVEKRSERPEMESTGKVPPVIPNRDNIRCSYWSLEEKSAAESRHDTFDTVTTGPETGPTVSKASSGCLFFLATMGNTVPSNLEMAPVSNHQDLDLQNTAAVVIQQLWRKYRQKCGNFGSPSTAEKGGGRGGSGRKPASGPSYINARQNYAATVIQAFWRGFTLRTRLTSALAAVTCQDTGEDDTSEEGDVDEFVFDEAALVKPWTLALSEDSPPRRCPESEQPLSLKPPGLFPEPSQYILPPPPVWRSKQAWVAGEQVDSASPVSSIRRQYASTEALVGRSNSVLEEAESHNSFATSRDRQSDEQVHFTQRSKSPASTSALSGLSERSERILEEWGFSHSHTALQMLKRAQKMKSKMQQQKKHRDPPVGLAMFRNCSYQLGPVEARNRQGQQNRNYIKAREAELGLQQAEKTEREQQERAQQWLHTQAAHSDRNSESVRFLPEISSDILNGGRVQLVAGPGYTGPHDASGLWANNSLASQPCKEYSHPRRNSLGHASKEVPSPKRVTSAPSKKERISFRDNPVQLSGGWGRGRQRDKVCK